jgi:hypothetical protein
MSKFIDQWNQFWFRMAPPHAIAIVRIAFGLYLIVEALTYLPVVPRMFSDQALTFSLWSLHVPEFFRFLLEPPSAAVVWIIALLYIAFCIAFTLGFMMRTALIFMIILWFYYYQLSFFLFTSSYHRIYLVLLFLFLVSGADRTFSYHMKRTKGSWFAWEPACVFVQRVIAVQMSFTYLGVGLQKAWLPGWQDGTALTYSLLGRWGTPLGRWVVGLNMPMWVWDLQVWGVKIFEFFLPFCLWIRRWQIPFMIGGAAFHIGIGVLMSIWWFVALIPAYLLFFAPEEVYAWCKRRSGGRIV